MYNKNYAFILVDCNNFYVSCERVFNPKLYNKAVVILSNNDGCIISRSNEAKNIGIKMGEPFYQCRDIINKNKVICLSSNYCLYGDMSSRIMRILQMTNFEVEIYSIDEAFLKYQLNNSFNIISYSKRLQHNIQQWTGIPTSIGIAPTKTLTKVANYIAKKNNNKICDLSSYANQTYAIKNLEVEKIWGISKGLGNKLRNIGIHTALQLRDANAKFIQKKFSIVLERIVYELRGYSCIDIEEKKHKKNIMSSKSFGKPIKDISSLEQALSSYITTACEKLRIQNTKANGIYIFLKTNYHQRNSLQYFNNSTIYLNSSTNDTSYLISIGKKILNKIYQEGYTYKKCGVTLLGLTNDEYEQKNIFYNNQDNLMSLIDKINSKMGKKTIFYAACGTNNEWKAKSSMRTPRYTSNWSDIISVY